LGRAGQAEGGERGDKGVERERFLDHAIDPQALKFGAVRLAEPAAHHKDQAGEGQVAGAAGELQAIQAGHVEIQDEDIKGARSRGKFFPRQAAVGERGDLMAVILQNLAHQAGDGIFVIDEHDAGGAGYGGGDSRDFSRTWSRFRGGTDGKAQVECRARARD